MKEAIKVCITGAAGQIAYALFDHILSGKTFGPDQPISLSLLDIPPMMGPLQGVLMEIKDCAYPLLQNISATADANDAFDQADVILMLGAMPRKEGMLRKDLLHANAAIFKTQGQIIDHVAKKSVKVLVVGNPANTNAYITSTFAPSIPPANFSALTRLDQNRAVALAAERCGVAPNKIKGVIIWGNHSNTQYPDLNHAICHKNNFERPCKDIINNTQWVQSEFMVTVQGRGAAVIAARKLSSALSAAKAISDHMHDWWCGLASKDEFVSMAVISDGSYNIPKGVVYSFPVTIDSASRQWKIVQGLTIDPFSQAKMRETLAELQEEHEEALAHLSST